MEVSEDEWRPYSKISCDFVRLNLPPERLRKFLCEEALVMRRGQEEISIEEYLRSVES